VEGNPAEIGGRLFGLLKAPAAALWQSYVEHPFVRRLADGSLPESCFRHYLVQDYIFLIHYARAYALGVYKGETVEELRYAASGVTGILAEELRLHLDYCGRWGLQEAEVLATIEDPRNMAYTRYVLERGLAGDYLDLMVALAPCVIGYAEIGARLLRDPATRCKDNPYYAWIESYGGPTFQQMGQDAADQLDRAAERRLGRNFERSPRFVELARTFEAATRLEVGFWDMGLDPPRS
jgi:thiaminase/transcriptional activator TenA